MYEVRSILEQPAAFAQRFPNQRHVALPEITKATVDQLRAPARGGLGKIVPLQQQRKISPRRRIDRATQPGGATAHDDDIPGFLEFLKAMKSSGAVHV